MPCDIEGPLTPSRLFPSEVSTIPSHVSPPVPTSRFRGLGLPALFLMIAMLNLTLPVVGLKELIIDRLGGTAADASWFFSVEMLAYVLFAPLWGLLSDRIRRRKPLVVAGFLLSAVFYWSFTQVESVAMLLLLRFAQGAVTVAGWSTLMALAVDHAPENARGRSMGVLGAALSLGVSLGVPLGGYLTRDLGTHAPLLIAAGLFIAIGLGSLALAEGLRLERRVTVPEILATLRQKPRLLLPYLFYFVDRYTVGLFVVVFPLYLASSLKVTDAAVKGQYLAAFLLPFALLQVLAGRLTERVGPRALLIGGSLAYGALLAFVGVSGADSLWWLMTGLGVLAALMFTPTLVLTAELSTPETRGSAMAGYNVAGSLGFAVGPVVGAWAHQAHGFGFAFQLAGALEIACALLGLLLILRWRRSRP